MALSAREALETLHSVLDADYCAAWALAAPEGDNYIDTVEIVRPEGWGYLKVTLGDGSNVCFSVMCVGA